MSRPKGIAVVRGSLEMESEAFSNAASVLSDRIAVVHARIIGLPGKAKVAAGEAGEPLVVLDRVGNGWDIIVHYHDDEDGSDVSRSLLAAPLVVKAKAARLLPVLVTRLLVEIRARRDLLAEATEAVAHVESLLTEEEGA